MKDEGRNTTGFPWETGDSIWYLIKKVSYLSKRHIEHSLRPIGISSQQAVTLRLLTHKPGMTQTELESALDIEKSSVCSLVNGLVDKKWAERRQHPDDARIRQIYLTPIGHAINDQAVPVVEATKSRSKDMLTEEEEMILKLLLQKVHRAYQ